MKTLIKNVFFLLFALIMLPFSVTYWLLTFLLNSDSLFAAYSQFISLLPGKVGSLMRAGFYRFTMKYCHANVVIGFGTLFSQRNTTIFKNTYVGPQCNIGSCIIEKDCLLGSGVHVLSGKGQHNFDDLSTPIREQGGSYSQIRIGEDSWIGNGAIISANIGKKCIIGAGSVVTKDIPDFSIAVGNPAKVIKTRA